MIESTDVGDVSIGYRTAGDPGAPPVILLHGLGDSGPDWAPVLDRLAVAFRLFVPDLRGHGDSSRPGDYSFESMRDDMLGFMDAVTLERVALVGHSMGAVVAVLVAQTGHDHRRPSCAPRPADRIPGRGPTVSPAAQHHSDEQLS